MGSKARRTPRKVTGYLVEIRNTCGTAPISVRHTIIDVDEASGIGSEAAAVKETIDDAVSDYPKTKWAWMSTQWLYEDA